MLEKKYSLKGLNCANCAAKIEKKVNDLPFVDDATVNFVTKELKIKVNEACNEDLSEIVQKIVRDTEDGVEVCEIEVKSKTVTCTIEGLTCAHCAAKIEKTLNKTEGITSANLDFVGSKLKLNIDNHQQKVELLNKVQTIIDKIEPGVKINEEKKERHHESHHHGEENHLSELIRLIVGTLVFISIIFVPNTSIFYLPMYIISYLLIGGDVVLRAVKNILRGQVFDENFLMTVATIAAFAIQEYPEAVAVMLFYQVGEKFQDLAVNRSRRSIKKLMSIRPDVANVKYGDDIVTVDIEDVAVNDIIVIKAGERVPLDGIIVEGESSLDTKALTGESLPMNVGVGEKVLSGCINIHGILTVRVTKTASESTVAKILELVENATSKKAPTENFITKFARFYTPFVTITALLLAVIPPLFISGAQWSEWLYRACIFLVISCPCALVISIPLGFFSGIGLASRNGVLVKGGNYLEALNHVEIAVFDKTGTLTEGTFVVTKVHPMISSQHVLLEKTAYIESFSNHPIALSVLKAYNQNVNQKVVSKVQELSGFGIKGYINDEVIIVGNAKLMNLENIAFEESNDIGSILYVAINHVYAGYIVVSDQVKKDAKFTISHLKSLGVKKTVMLSGDKMNVAKSVGKEIKIDEVYGELLPQDKLTKVEELMEIKSRNGKLIFVGDGINDTPVLARADIGIAMGGLGADAAIDVADVVIMTDEPSKIVTAVRIAKITKRIVWQNIIFALGIKLFFLILGAFGIATMWEAVFADVGVSLIAILNSMRILRFKFNE